MGQIFNDLTISGETNVVGPSKVARKAIVLEATTSRTCTSADYGKTLLLSYAGNATMTLPANGAPKGSWIDFISIGTNATVPIIAAATGDTLITFNNQEADSVTFGTGERIGSYVRVISTGTFWIAVNMSGSHTMTVTDA